VDFVILAAQTASGGNATFATLAFLHKNSRKQRKNSDSWLFFGSLNRRQPRISPRIRRRWLIILWQNSKNSEKRKLLAPLAGFAHLESAEKLAKIGTI
jgi:hypothetical protein